MRQSLCERLWCSSGRETSEGTVWEGNREEVVGGQLYRKKEKNANFHSWWIQFVCATIDCLWMDWQKTLEEMPERFLNQPHHSVILAPLWSRLEFSFKQHIRGYFKIFALPILHTLPLSYVVLRKTAAGMQYSPSSALWNLQERIPCFLSACSFTSTLCLSHWSMCHDEKQPSAASILLLVYHGLQILKDWLCLVALQVVSFESHVAFIPWPFCITSIILVIPLVYLTNAYRAFTASQLLLLS